MQQKILDRDATLGNSPHKWPKPVRKRVENDLCCKENGKQDVELAHQHVQLFIPRRLRLCLGRNRNKVSDDEKCNEILNDRQRIHSFAPSVAQDWKVSRKNWSETWRVVE